MTRLNINKWVYAGFCNYNGITTYYFRRFNRSLVDSYIIGFKKWLASQKLLEIFVYSIPLFLNKLRVQYGVTNVHFQCQFQVNVVFHVAASVRFHEPLTIALNINLRATQDMLDLGKEIKSLKVLNFITNFNIIRSFMKFSVSLF